jgi:hypothetical protein
VILDRGRFLAIEVVGSMVANTDAGLRNPLALQRGFASPERYQSKIRASEDIAIFSSGWYIALRIC